MELDLNSICVCSECACMVMGPHHCRPKYWPGSTMERIAEDIMAERAVAKARRDVRADMGICHECNRPATHGRRCKRCAIRHRARERARGSR